MHTIAKIITQHIACVRFFANTSGICGIELAEIFNSQTLQVIDHELITK